jgi:hypothetical protein
MESYKEKLDEQDQLAQYLATPIGIILAIKTLQANVEEIKERATSIQYRKEKAQRPTLLPTPQP